MPLPAGLLTPGLFASSASGTVFRLSTIQLSLPFTFHTLPFLTPISRKPLLTMPICTDLRPHQAGPHHEMLTPFLPFFFCSAPSSPHLVQSPLVSLHHHSQRASPCPTTAHCKSRPHRLSPDKTTSIPQDATPWLCFPVFIFWASIYTSRPLKPFLWPLPLTLSIPTRSPFCTLIPP